MLKKLAKYGNSTTLVIDKAILEILNMNESSIVKLTTDGKSLIITPVEQNDQGKVNYDNLEAMQMAKEALIKKMPKAPNTIDSEIASKMQKEFSQVFQKHNAVFIKFSHEISQTKEFQEELALITEKFDPVKQCDEYLKECRLLKLRFCPELADMQNEIDEIHKKYGSSFPTVI
ncbi:MAG: hypothetical protein P4L22_06385 [Candidatus Babeliales bacterium]|nr:hypothetical protein [Candidatus Babeliales bacterium]